MAELSQTPPDADSTPKSAAAVKKTPSIKTPREAELEKALSRLEDQVSGLASWRSDVDRYMAETGGKVPSKPTRPPGSAPSTAQTEPKRGFFGNVGKELGIED